MKHICIDARLYGISHTGIGRYVENLLKYLPVTDDFKITVIISDDLDKSSLPDKYNYFSARYHPYAIPSQLEMLYIWWKIKPDLLHVTQSSIPGFWPGKIIVTFHDLIRHISKGKDTTTKKYFLYWIKYLGYLLVDYLAIYRSDKIIVPSYYWKNILLKKFKLPDSRVEVTYEGVDSKISNAVIGKPLFISKVPFVVYTGTIYPHKNIPVLLKAIQKLDEKYKLVLVTARSVFTKRTEEMIATYNIANSVTILGKLTDDELATLYSKALAFVLPSFIEGFGLTGIEAMSVGLPVIASNSSCLPEIYQDSALYFDPQDSNQLCDQITKLEKDKKLRTELIDKGYKQAKKYSWDKMAKQTWKIYQSALQ